jgi:hypothetical protein
MKDYYDVHALLRENAFNADRLADAIAATFARRRTLLLEAVPVGLSDEFASDVTRQSLWSAFLGKNRLRAPPLGTVVREIREGFAIPLDQARSRQAKA